MEGVFDISNFNVIEDEENYYFFLDYHLKITTRLESNVIS